MHRCLTPREQTDFSEWRIFELLKRHQLGLTKSEIIRFSGLESRLTAAALEHLQVAGVIVSEPYARGALWYVTVPENKCC